MDDEFISISAAAKAIGLNKSTLSRQVKAGLIRSQDGKVKLSQVLEDRASNIDASIWEHRQKHPDASPAAPEASPLHATEAALHATSDLLHATDDADDDDEALDRGERLKLLEDGAAISNTDLNRETKNDDAA